MIHHITIAFTIHHITIASDLFNQIRFVILFYSSESNRHSSKSLLQE